MENAARALKRHAETCYCFLQQPLLILRTDDACPLSSQAYKLAKALLRFCNWIGTIAIAILWSHEFAPHAL